MVTRLLDEGAIRGRVLDVGCGTGLPCQARRRGRSDVVGIDLATTCRRPGAGARRRGGGQRPVRRGDALELGRLGDELGAPFDTVLDVGLFHVLQADDRHRYATALASVVRPGGAGFVVAWSDRNPFGIGPARVTRREIRHAFRADTCWRVVAIEDAELETLLPMGRVHAWLARLRRR